MLNVEVTREFEQLYEKLPRIIQQKAEKQERIFRENPFHPSLHTEKLVPKGKELWSFRIDKRYRIIFRFKNGNTARFLLVGPHDWIYKLRF